MCLKDVQSVHLVIIPWFRRTFLISSVELYLACNLMRQTSRSCKCVVPSTRCLARPPLWNPGYQRDPGWKEKSFAFYFPIYWEDHHPIWRTPWFFRGVGIPTTNQYRSRFSPGRCWPCPRSFRQLQPCCPCWWKVRSSSICRMNSPRLGWCHGGRWWRHGLGEIPVEGSGFWGTRW